MKTKMTKRLSLLMFATVLMSLTASAIPVKRGMWYTLTLADGSTFNGCINGNITNAAGNSVSTETGTVNVTLGGDCTWTLTADTYITSLKGDASCIKANGHRLFVGGKELKVN